MPEPPTALALNGDSLWVGSDAGQVLYRIDLDEFMIAEAISVGHPVAAIAVVGGELWFTTR